MEMVNLHHNLVALETDKIHKPSTCVCTRFVLFTFKLGPLTKKDNTPLLNMTIGGNNRSPRLTSKRVSGCVLGIFLDK